MTRFVKNGVRILARRLRRQGLRTTLIWAYGRGVPYLTGTPILKYSRVTPLVYVGPQFRKSGRSMLQKKGFRHLVNMRIEFDDAEHGLELESYCHLPTVDDTAISMEHLSRGIEFIHGAVEQGEKVYIHCSAGVGRAPTLALAYFISEGMTLADALSLVKRARPFIYIMPPQMELLRSFETESTAGAKAK